MAVAFAIGLPLSLLALVWGGVLFSPEKMTDIIADELIGSGTLQALAVETMLEGGRSDRGALEFLARQDLDQLFSHAIPPDWPRHQIAINIDNLYAWIDDDRRIPEIVLDIQPIKQHLQQGGATELVVTVVRSWPPCGMQQIEQFNRGIFASEELPPFLCQPPEPLLSELISTTTEIVLRQARVLPDTIRYQEDAAPEISLEQTMEIKRSLRFLRGFAGVGWLLPMSVLGLITALAARSWPQLLRWWGAPTLAAGLGTFMALFISGSMVEQAQNQGVLREMPFFFQSIFRDVLDRIQDAASGQLFVLAFIITAIGLAMSIYGLVLRRRGST